MLNIPNLNKNCDGYQKLDYILGSMFAYRLSVEDIPDGVLLIAQDITGTGSMHPGDIFSQKELEEIHPDTYTWLQLATKNKVGVVKDTWDFWKKYTPDMKSLADSYDLFETDITFVNEPNSPGANHILEIVVGTEVYEVVELTLSETAYFHARKRECHLHLSKTKCDQKYPGLFDAALTGFTLGMNSTAILDSWRDKPKETIDVQVLLPVSVTGLPR